MAPLQLPITIWGNGRVNADVGLEVQLDRKRRTHPRIRQEKRRGAGTWRHIYSTCIRYYSSHAIQYLQSRENRRERTKIRREMEIVEQQRDEQKRGNLETGNERG